MEEPGIPVIEFLSAEKIFPNGARGLAPISLSIAQGEFVSLIGPSGCGKSTLLGLAANLIEPTDGRILWWRRKSPHLGVGKRVSFVFQEPTLMPWVNVAANVRIALRLNAMLGEGSEQRIAEALGNVELQSFHSAYPKQLSGGQRMRVSIARALVTEPDLLLMDEPFGALDEFTRNKLDDDLSLLCSARNVTTLFVTHSIYEAIFLSSRVIVMAANPGRVFAEYFVDEPGPRSDLFRDTPKFATCCSELSALLRAASRESR